MPRKYVKKRQESAYTLEDLLKAVSDVKEKRKTYREASNFYSIPVSVIFNRIKGRKIPLDKMGAGAPTCLPSRIENHIVNCIIARSRIGYPCDKEELFNLVGQYAEQSNLKTRFKNNKPGEEWYRAFMKRHPTLSLKKPEHLQKLRKDARKPDIIFDFYNKLQAVIVENNLTDKPMLIYNADESGFNSDPSRVRSLGEKGKALVRISGGSGRESTTVLACVSADGSYLPPFIVFKGLSVQARWVSEEVIPGTLFSASKNGWMEEPQFYNWFVNGFIPHIKRVRQQHNLTNKVLLLYDGHKSHFSVRIIVAAMQNKVELMKFPSHLTDKLQPLDKSVFKSVKNTWDKLLVAYGKEQMGQGSGRLPKDKFAQFISLTWRMAMTSKNIISGFESTGTFPVNHEKFPHKEFNAEELRVYLENKNNNSETASVSSLSNTPSSLSTLSAASSSTVQKQTGIQDDVELLAQNSSIVLEKPVAKDSEISPNQEALKQIFKIDSNRKERIVTEKVSTPRLKNEKYGEVLTSENVLERLRRAEELKKQKLNGKRKKKIQSKESAQETACEKKVENSTEETVQVKANKKIKMLKNTKEIASDSSSEDDEDTISYQESENSPWDTSDNEDDEFMKLITVGEANLRSGKFAVVSFKGGRRGTTTYKYVCLINDVDLEEEEVRVTALKSDSSRKVFCVDENDISYVRFEQILGICEEPDLLLKGERVFYQFRSPIDIFEKP